MRDWNSSAFNVDTVPPAVYRIPMRDWNPHPQIYFHWVELFIEYLWGIETKKNILIGSDKVAFIEYLWGIETSIPNRCIRARYNPFIEYLWGIETWLKMYAKLSWEWFIEYLWGIETVIHQLILTKMIMFIEYLWGIETKSLTFLTLFMIFVYRIPMRDWN